MNEWDELRHILIVLVAWTLVTVSFLFGGTPALAAFIMYLVLTAFFFAGYAVQ